MFDLRLVGTPVVEFMTWKPEFLDPDARIAEVYGRKVRVTCC